MLGTTVAWTFVCFLFQFLYICTSVKTGFSEEIEVLLRVSSIEQCRKLGLIKSFGWGWRSGIQRAFIGILAFSAIHQSWNPEVILCCCVASTTAHRSPTPSKWMTRRWKVESSTADTHICPSLSAGIVSTPIPLLYLPGTHLIGRIFLHGHVWQVPIDKIYQTFFLEF